MPTFQEVVPEVGSLGIDNDRVDDAFSWIGAGGHGNAPGVEFMLPVDFFGTITIDSDI